MSTAAHPHEIVTAVGFTFCAGCRGVLTGTCGCVMHQDGIDTRNCTAHRGAGHVGRCMCGPQPPVVLRYEIRCKVGGDRAPHDGADLEYGPHDDGGARARAVAALMERCHCGSAFEVYCITRQKIA